MTDWCVDTLNVLYGPNSNRSLAASLMAAAAADASSTAEGSHRQTGYSYDNMTSELITFTTMLSTTLYHLTQNISADGVHGAGMGAHYTSDPTLEAVSFYLGNVFHPFVCVFGLIGNVFNVIVLSRHRMKATMDSTMERGAHTGLMALAVSDELYCLFALLDALLSRPSSAFTYRDPSMYARVYGKYFLNTFVRTGTWLTVIMAAGRFAAICRPIQARYLLGVNCTRVAVAVTFIFWTLIGLPMIWSFSVIEVPCPPDDVIIVVDLGRFVLEFDGQLKTSFTYIWAILGFFLPVSLLVYFNFHLIVALRESSRIRSLYRVSSKVTTAGSRVTPTLVAIVCMLLALVSPSEMLQFYYYGVKNKVEMFNLAIVITNILQTFNFSFNFVLYCIVNVHFRETWKELLHLSTCRKPVGLGTSYPCPRSRPNMSLRAHSTIETAI